MNSKQAQRLARDPRAMMRFQATGKPPEMVRLDSPLIQLLEKIPRRYRHCFVGIKLGPELGYARSLEFRDADQLLRWIKPAPEVFADRPGPGEQARLKHFHQPITLDAFERHCTEIKEPGRTILRKALPSSLYGAQRSITGAPHE